LRPTCLILISLAALAQEPVRRDSIVVTGAYEPLALEEADRSVTLLPARAQALVLNTLTDVLQLDPSLDVRRRAPDGVQSDLSIRGSNFGQTLVLLNGQRLNDAQTGHHNMDIPVPLESVERIEVLRGSGSTLYGSDAVGGAINIITKPPEAAEMRLRTAAGNFGVNQQRGTLSFRENALSQQLTFSRDFSSGFRPNRDYRNLALASSTRLDWAPGAGELTLAYMDHPFGADQAYGAYNSWENTKTWFASLRQALGERTSAAFTFRRHSDLFVLYRDRPEAFTNHHAVESWQASLRRSERLQGGAALNWGAEGFGDSIDSNNLGRHSRGRAAAYASLDVRALRRFSLSLGVREEVWRKWSAQFSPTVAAGAWLSSKWKLRASASRAFRVPTYTDLYYHDPANLGSPDLRPERAWSYEGGVDYYPTQRVSASLTVFQRRERDGIDYVRRSLNDIWRATNFQRLEFTGAEASVRFAPRRGQQIDLRYSGLHGAQDAVAGVYSKYVFNYPTNAAVAAWTGSMGGVIARTRIGVVQRLAREPYALWDVSAGYGRGRVRPFLQLANVTSTSYQEILGVDMPGRSVVGGIEIVVFGRR
jgi:iron complex outermembrane receptor protein